jgi:glucose-1-phosphate cytidylyltransferase
VKVVIFCGGLGLRIRGYSENVPKPMIRIGGQPILWHIMKYYAHFGHKDFILCLGYQGESIKRFFLDYDPRLTNNFILSPDPLEYETTENDLKEWRITFVDTGLDSTIGERLRRVRPFLVDEPYFLASYSDSLTDAPLNRWVERFTASDHIASFMCVRPDLSLHHVTLDSETHLVQKVSGLRETLRINGGFFVFRQDFFDYLHPNEEIVEEPFARLIERNALLGQVHDGFWATMDTYKDHHRLEQRIENDDAPWRLWRAYPHRFNPSERS